MGLNKSKGNMYNFVTHTWNTVKGRCPHDCSYCYMKRWGALKETHFDAKELKTDLGSGNIIFVGSSCDMFAESIHDSWTYLTLEHCEKYDNRYLFQSKNPMGINDYINDYKLDCVVCTTIETNRWYSEIMVNSPRPESRALGMEIMRNREKYVTIEPIMDFDLESMVELIKQCDPVQVNIGADSGRNGLPEPPFEKVLELINQLKKFTTIAKKKNLDRLGT